MEIAIGNWKTKEEMYALMEREVHELFEEAGDLTASLSNLSAVFSLFLSDVNWCGFYLLKDGELVLGPFQGKPAVPRIRIGDGVCGTAVKEEKNQRVDDVHRCENHIACDMASSSELVTLIRNGDEIFGVIDIDSPVLSRFDEADAAGMERIASAVSSHQEQG